MADRIHGHELDLQLQALGRAVARRLRTGVEVCLVVYGFDGDSGWASLPGHHLADLEASVLVFELRTRRSATP